MFTNSKKNLFSNSQNNSKFNKTPRFFVLDEKMFPSINIANDSKKIETTKLDFLEKMMSPEKIIEPVDENILSPGWIEIKYNPKTGVKKIRKNQEISRTFLYNQNQTSATFLDVIEKLNTNYTNWKNKYIQMWGEEEYEKYYKFPNYEYDYFDLDEIDSDLSLEEDDDNYEL
jgi:hypothetical protein